VPLFDPEISQPHLEMFIVVARRHLSQLKPAQHLPIQSCFYSISNFLCSDSSSAIFDATQFDNNFIDW